MKNNFNLYNLLRSGADAAAIISGNNKYSNIKGKVMLYQINSGVIIRAEINGLPQSTQECYSPVFGFHIHSGSSCTGTKENPFENADGHYNPGNCPHPYHAGDMPPLFGANGKAFLIFLTNRINVSEIIGKTVIIHAHPDDFTSQPSGNAGEMIACGVISSMRR